MVQRARLHLPSSEFSESFTDFLDSFSFLDVLSSPEKSQQKKVAVKSGKKETRGRKKKEVLPQEVGTIVRASFL